MGGAGAPSQLERIVRLALGKRVLDASTTIASENLPQVTTSAAGPAGGHQAGLEVMYEGEGESHGTDCTSSEGPPLASRVVQPTSPRSVEAAALEPSGAPAVQPPGGDPAIMTMITVPGGKRKSRAPGELPERLWRSAMERLPRTATKCHCTRGRGSVRCLAALGSTPQATARPSWI
jgi:hypothetical protein